MISLYSYYKMLEAHDWYYDFSDDPRVFRAGQGALGKLQTIAKQSQEHLALFNAYKTYVNKKGPRPDEPKEET